MYRFCIGIGVSLASCQRMGGALWATRVAIDGDLLVGSADTYAKLELRALVCGS